MTEDMPRSQTITDTEILAAFEKTPSPITTAPDLAEELPLSQDGIRQRLKSMQENRLVVGYHVGARSTVWWLTAKGERARHQ